MWETPFDESMLAAQPGVAIYCPEDSLAEELFEVLRQNGLGTGWLAGMTGDRVYCVSKKDIRHGSQSVVEITSPYCDYTRCTFYGINTPDFDVADEDEILSFLTH